jgi:hypothetical protein
VDQRLFTAHQQALARECSADLEIQIRQTAAAKGNDFALLLSFLGVRPSQYPIGRYPTIAEFRMMLAALDQETSTTHWKGEYFFALRGQRDGETEFSFRVSRQRHRVHLVRKGSLRATF